MTSDQTEEFYEQEDSNDDELTSEIFEQSTSENQNVTSRSVKNTPQTCKIYTSEVNNLHTNKLNSNKPNFNTGINGNAHTREPTVDELLKKFKSKTKKHIPPIPTLDDIINLCDDPYLNLSVDPHRFFEYYNRRGWRTDGKPINDWTALLFHWEETEPFYKPKQGK